MVIKQQLQVINFTTSLSRSQSGNSAIANIEWYIGKVRQRSLEYIATTCQDSTNYTDSAR